jgi:hypothetical protein
MSLASLPCIILDVTWNHIEKARVPSIGVVMIKYGRRDGVVLVGGVV